MTGSSPSVTLSSRMVVPDEVLFQEMNGEAVILDLASERYFGLDTVGTRFWELLSDDPSLQAAFDALSQEYDVAPERLQGDLLALADALLEAGLLRLE